MSVHTASIRSSEEALDQSLSCGSGNPLRMTLTVICLLGESSSIAL
ncbi:MAG TPA: hypothetical protein VFD62_09500 [Pyrinomonadaceae bacterium]|nr:hypothetical protein [Pyrinomonadaceae bacterium]